MPYTKNELVYTLLIVVLPIAFAYLFHKESIWEFIVYLGIGMVFGFLMSVVLVLSINRSYQKREKSEDFNA
jgi:preprotein translocase subunit SecF